MGRVCFGHGVVGILADPVKDVSGVADVAVLAVGGSFVVGGDEVDSR